MSNPALIGSKVASTPTSQKTDALGTPAGSALPKAGRSVIATRYGIVASSQPLASMAGVQVLQRGGNAVDAAIAANAVVGVMEPTGNGIGGDLFAIVHEAKTGKLHGLNASGWAPAGMTPGFLKAQGITELPARGVYSVTVPGVVAGWAALRERFGSLPFSTLLSPAIFYADKGFPVNEVTAGLWNNALELLRSERNAAATYLIDGRAPKAGEVFRNPELAASLRVITSYGRDGYYKGRTAEAIVAICREKGGAMAMEDLAGFEAEWVTPISTEYRGWTVYEIPPNTQGIAALMMLNIMEQFPMSDYGFHSARALHVMIEAKKLAYADMLRYTADMRMAKVPVEQMLNKKNAAERAGLIGERAAASVQPSRLAGVTDGKGNDTIYIDRDRHSRRHRLAHSEQLHGIRFGTGAARDGVHAAKSRLAVLARREQSESAGRAQASAAYHYSGVHAEGQCADRLRHHGRLEPGAGARAVRRQHRRLRHEHSAGARGRTVYQVDVRRLRRADRRTRCRKRCATNSRAWGMNSRSSPRAHNTFGFGQAVMSNGSGVHFGASDPRHDGAAIPEPGPVFSEGKP